jgi:hypothetical protein
MYLAFYFEASYNGVLTSWDTSRVSALRGAAARHRTHPHSCE